MNCIICNNHLDNRQKRYCSKPCQYASFSGCGNPMFMGAKLKAVCKHCSTGFEYYKGSGSGFYCSKECSDNGIERIIKMSKSKTKTFEGVPDRMIKARIRSSGLYKQWIKKVIERDKSCSGCGSRDNLQAHHKVPFAILYEEVKLIQFSNCSPLFDLSNGEVLCKDCHRKTDSYFKIPREKKLFNAMRGSFNNSPGGYKTFPAYYENKLEELINHFKAKLDQ